MAVDVAVTSAAINTTTGTQDITVSGFGTPKACIIFATYATADGTAVVDAGLGMGMGASSTTETAIWGSAEDGQGTTDTHEDVDDGLFNMTAAGAATPADLAILDSFITDGVRIDVTAAPSSAHILKVVLFGGSDLTAHTGHIGLGDTLDLATDITSVGFEADLVFLQFSSTLGAPAAGLSNFRRSLGIVHNDKAGGVTQRAIANYWRNGQATVNDAMMNWTDRGGGAVFSNAGVDFECEVGTFDSSGFTVTTRLDGGNSSEIHWLALDLGGAVSSYVGTYATPTATGNHSNSAVGFTPQFVFHLLSGMTAIDTGYNSGDPCGIMGVSIATDSAEHSVAVMSEDGVATSNTESLVNSTAVDLNQADGTTGYVDATLSSMDANGYTLNYTNTHTSALQWFVLAIEENAAGPATAIKDSIGMGIIPTAR